MVSPEDLRYPIGPFAAPAVVSPAQVDAWIDEIARLPSALRAAVEGLSPEQLETPYRPGGWNAREVVHHVVDSHLNSFVRFKWTLTEERPTIKPYFEDRWATLPDYIGTPIAISLQLLDALHARWVCLLRGLGASDLQREFLHPEQGAVRLDVNIGIYAWHGRHHLAHITRLAAREGWAS
ncbi:putative metal-dependent hydrolase [bacterium]|nr:putative metal-dependent hydrolase [bacterium]